jgi:hypothetical protein
VPVFRSTPSILAKTRPKASRCVGGGHISASVSCHRGELLPSSLGVSRAGELSAHNLQLIRRWRGAETYTYRSGALGLQIHGGFYRCQRQRGASPGGLGQEAEERHQWGVRQQPRTQGIPVDLLRKRPMRDGSNEMQRIGGHGASSWLRHRLFRWRPSASWPRARSGVATSGLCAGDHRLVQMRGHKRRAYPATARRPAACTRTSR